MGPRSSINSVHLCSSGLLTTGTETGDCWVKAWLFKRNTALPSPETLAEYGQRRGSFSSV